MNIKNKRLSKGLTQQSLSKMLGCGRTTVTMWENGQAIPSVDKLQKLSEIFNCSIDELLKEFDDGRSSNGELK